jgi:hypothetical protein
VFDEFDNGLFGEPGYNVNPAFTTFAGFGYDPESYISTAALVPSPYTTQQLIISKLGGLNRLIESVDDSQPPIGSLNPNAPPNNPAYLTYLSVIQTVVTEVNGYLSSIYPCPLAQTGTVATLKVTDVSLNGLGTVTALEMVQNGNYCVAPNVAQSPAYLRHLDAAANVYFWGANWFNCQKGRGLSLTAAYANANYSDESGQVLQAQAVTGTPAIVSGGTGYNIGDLLVFTGGSSFVPAKVRQATLDLICHTLYKRRLAPEEKNPFSALAKMWRDLFTEIGEGDKQLDGTYKRFFSAGASWGTRSVLYGANSL